MLKKVVVTNYLDESIEYNIEGVQTENESGLLITSIDGLGPVKATINMTEIPTADGSIFNSARLTSRNIVIEALFTYTGSIEEARHLTYKYFPVKSKVKIQVVTDERTVETEGYVESNEPDIFSEQTGCQISILCPSAYFEGDKTDYELPATITYDGEVETGIELTFGLPTEDLADDLAVTKVSATKGSDQTMSFDFAQMSNLVPNSAPRSQPTKNGIFISNGPKSKFLSKIYESLDPLGNGVWPVIDVDRNRIDIFTGVYHAMVDLETGTVQQLPNTNRTPANSTTFYGRMTRNLVCYHGEYYIVALDIDDDETTDPITRKRGIYKFFEEYNEWRLVYDNDDFHDDGEDAGIGYTHSYYCNSVVYNDYIYIFTTIYVPRTGFGEELYTNTLLIFDGSDIVNEISLTQEYRDFFPGGMGAPGTTHDYYNFNYTPSVVVNGNEIHVFNIGGSFPTKHYIWDGTNWIDDTNFVSSGSPLASIINSNMTAVAFKNKVYLIQAVSGSAGTRSYFFEDGQWSTDDNSPTLPYRYTGNPVASDDYVVFVGNVLDKQSSGISYTAPYNNVKLIENDRLVVNTNRGKKSVRLIRGSNSYNVLNILEDKKIWLQLNRGSNEFTSSAEGTDADRVVITATTSKLYGGA